MKDKSIDINYDEVEAWCNIAVDTGDDFLFSVDKFDDELNSASKRFQYPVESLNSFLRNVHLKRVKKQTFVIRNSLDKQILPAYIQGQSILELAKTFNFPPALLCRSIIEKITSLSKKKISGALRNPIGTLNDINIIQHEYLQSEKNCKGNNSISSSKEIIDPFSGELIKHFQNDKISRIAKEVQEAIFMDPLYGPRSDRERQIIGTEYEIVLEQILRSMNVPFETERDLKKRGTSKTPDILFSCPVAVKVPKVKPKRKKPNTIVEEEEDFDWKMICWIDSKALFGDVYTHRKNVLPQAEGYVHRFGPGLVLYWFGHAPIDRLDNGHGDVIVTGWNSPKQFLLPSGENVSKGIRFSNF